MATSGEAETDRNGESGASSSVQGGAALPREKPILSGEAKESHILPPADTPSTSPEATPDLAAMGLLRGPAAAARGTDSTGAAPSQSQSSSASKRGLWPLAAAIVLGAVIAVAGALGLHHLDQTPEQLAAVAARVDTLEQSAQQLQGVQQDVTSLGKRVSVLEAGTQVQTAALAELQQRIRALASAAADQKSGAMPADLAPLSTRLDKLEEKLAGLDHQVTELAGDLTGLKAARSAAANRAGLNAVALLAADLMRRLDRGEAFASDLAALVAHGIDKARLAPLEPAAAHGVATQVALAKDFAAATPAILAAEPETQVNGFLGRLAQDAAHLVRIHKIGDTKANDLAGQIARLAAALNGGRLDEALKEWAGLPADARQKSAAFGEALQNRIAAETAAKAIETEALASLAKAKS